MKKLWYITGFLVLAVGVGGFGTLFYYTRTCAQSENFIDFVYDRDIADILKIFDENWYWLMPAPPDTYHPGYVDYVFKYRAPQANPFQHNKLTIKVLRIDNQVAGFVAYYMKSKKSGMLLFLAVKDIFRGKQYGEKLARYAVGELCKAGATEVHLLTRVDNIPAQKIYKKLGFKERLNDGEGFVYFIYIP
jgi:ribosomal protein S18 acetylase RimI-like enzyme